MSNREPKIIKLSIRTLTPVSIGGDKGEQLSPYADYVFSRDGKMLQLTHDQNYLTRLMEKVRSGEITEQEALSHPKREALISYCGIRELSMVEINLQPLQLKSGDVIVLCSDGLYRLLSRQEMIDVLQETAEDMNLAAFKLTAAATDKNFRGQDNTSVILIKIK